MKNALSSEICMAAPERGTKFDERVRKANDSQPTIGEREGRKRLTLTKEEVAR